MGDRFGPEYALGSRVDQVRDLPICRVGTLNFPYALCEERFGVPGLLGMLVRGDMSYLEP